MSDEEKEARFSFFTLSGRNAAVVLALTLLAWVLFYEAQLPLDLPATGVIALAALLLVLAVQFVWSRVFRARGKPGGKNP